MAIDDKNNNTDLNLDNLVNKAKILTNKEQFIEFFIKDALNIVIVLEEIIYKQDNLTHEDISLYTTGVNAIKIALLNIGQSKLSEYAYKLEQAGNHEILPIILNETSAFLRQLRSVIHNLSDMG